MGLIIRVLPTQDLHCTLLGWKKRPQRGTHIFSDDCTVAPYLDLVLSYIIFGTMDLVSPLAVSSLPTAF